MDRSGCAAFDFAGRLLDADSPLAPSDGILIRLHRTNGDKVGLTERGKTMQL